jgi:hypothetical protein
MREVATAQEELSQEWTWIRMGNQIKQMRVHCPVVFQIGDAKSQDMLACRYTLTETQKGYPGFVKLLLKGQTTHKLASARLLEYACHVTFA